MEQAINNDSKNRMVLLLRNSSKKQAEKKINDAGQIEFDIPLQRDILTPWAERLGYVIVREFVEGGVSGFKVSAAKRDAVVEIKEMANRGEFDEREGKTHIRCRNRSDGSRSRKNYFQIV